LLLFPAICSLRLLRAEELDKGTSFLAIFQRLHVLDAFSLLWALKYLLLIADLSFAEY
jgi:hypothetical protein